jgi:ATPase subunit of ABC transporter with duplicated ATPase domains
MLLTASIAEKYMGSKLLFRDLVFSVQEDTKVGLIGRNGVGKSTLFGMLTGEDTDFLGSIERKKGLSIILTAQEHFLSEEVTTLDYILQHVPRYYELKEIIDTYPNHMGDDLEKIHTYSEALQEFGDNNYYTVEDEIVEALRQFDIDLDAALRPLISLSGGQKRFVELVKVGFSRADLILLDEPTNHLDYYGKALFLRWLKGVKTAVCIISHDRDVLKEVNAVIEVRDYQAFTYPGNYESYIKQNGTATVTQIGQYESALKRLETLHKQIQTARARKGAASDSRPKILEERLQREYDALEASLEKPSFWIDKGTTAELGKDVTERYDRYKARTITIGSAQKDKHVHQLLELHEVTAGYDKQLFPYVSFTLSHGDKLEIRGRNGAGKSTLLNTILSEVAGYATEAKMFHGSIKASGRLRVGVYEQEIDPKYLSMPLGRAVEQVYIAARQPLVGQTLNGILASYLFDPIRDKELLVKQLSGGQKARFQLIRMLSGNPNLLILDEPTNHLDLPSIEELEEALLQYHGALLYVSHDSYFLERMAGQVIHIGKA